MRVGLDVGGTHTDAVLLNGDGIAAAAKVLTTSDVTSGILEALERVLEDSGVAASAVDAVMLGTTQFTNAVVERRELAEVAAIRIGLPSGAGLTPMIGWPADIAAALGGHVYPIHGGYLYDGTPLAPLDDAEVDAAIADICAKGLETAAITSAFSPMNAAPELAVAKRLRAALPKIRITLSHRIGRIGMLERENAALLNAALLDFADRVVGAFSKAFTERRLDAGFFVSQNDGTLMAADVVRDFPALTFASGPTNSLRGASRLTGLSDAIVVDIGGTTTDIGVLVGGFPRESATVVEVGGVRTNFRMPDVLAVGLGGGSLVSEDGAAVGPRSVGHRLVKDALVFGGDRLTATDVVVADGRASVGDRSLTAGLEHDVVACALGTIRRTLEESIDRMRPAGEPLPVVLVGGGALLAGPEMSVARRVLRPDHADVANAVGAAIAQVGGETERLVSYVEEPRDEAIRRLGAEAVALAVSAGADAATVRLADIDETSVAYMAEGMTRLRIKAVGEVAGLGTEP